MGSGNTNFLSTVGVQSLGTSDIDKMVAAIDKQSSALENLGKKATQVNDHPGFAVFAEKIRAGIQDPLGTVSTFAESALKGLGPLGVQAAATGAAFAAGGVAIFSFAKSLGEYGTQIENAALRTGLTVKEVTQFSFAARVAGQDVSVFERLMRGLTQAVEENSDKGALARVWLQKFGVDLNAVRQGTASTSEVLLQVAAGLDRLPNTFDRNKAALDLFRRAGIDAIPVLRNLAGNLSIAKEHGWGPDDAELQKLLNYQKTVAEIETSWAQLIIHFKEAVIPHFEKQLPLPPLAPDANFLDRIQHWLAAPGFNPIDPFASPSVPANLAPMGPPRLPLPDDSALDARVAEHLRVLNLGLSQRRTIDEDIGKLERENATGGDVGLTSSQRTYREKIAQEGISGSEKTRYARAYLPSVFSEMFERERRVREASGHSWLELFSSPPPETGWDRAAAEARQAEALYAVKDPLRLLQSPFSAPAGFASPEEQLRTARDQSARGLGLYSLQANLGGVNEAPQADQLYKLKLKYADDEYAALKRLAETRETEDQKQQAREDALDQLHQKRFDADMERQQSILQIALQQKGASEATASGLFDAIHSRTTNQYWRQFAVGQERQLFTNAASPLILGATRFLGSAIPGQTDAAGNPTDIGKLLHGTLLDSANADPSRKTAENTLGIWTEIKSLRADLRKIATGSSDPNAPISSSTSSLYGLPSSFSGINPTLFGSGGLLGTGIGTSLYDLPSASSVFTNPLLNPGLATSSGTSGFAQFLSGVSGGPSSALASFLGTPRGTVGYGPDGTPLDQYGNPITSSTATQVGQGVSIAAAAATGIMAAVKDFSHGGAGGALGGVSALAGLASMIPGAGVVAAPIAAVTSLLGSLLSTGPQQREKDIFNALSSNRYLAPTALNVTQGPGGNYEDFDARGNLRTSNFSAVPTVAEPYITSRVVNGQRTYYDVPGGQLAPYSNGPTGAGQTAGSSVPQIGVLNLNAIDTQSGVDFLNKNRSAIGRNVTEHLQTNNGGPLAAEIRFHANS